jgi:hypothetical protein
MRRFLIVLTALVLGIVALTSPAAAGSSHDVARGHGGFSGEEMDFNASANFNGSEPKGHVTFTNHFGGKNVFDGNVTCLTVVGNLAVIAGDITSVRGPNTFPATSYVIWATDNGKSGPTPDSATFALTGGPGPTVCPPPFVVEQTFDGDVVVQDG